MEKTELWLSSFTFSFGASAPEKYSTWAKDNSSKALRSPERDGQTAQRETRGSGAGKFSASAIYNSIVFKATLAAPVTLSFNGFLCHADTAGESAITTS